MSTGCKFGQASEAKAAHWFSRRHQTSAEHTAEVMERYEEERNKKIDAEVRVESWQSLSPQEQLARLDARLGIGVGAVKQRKKINAKLAGSAAVPAKS